MNPVRSEETLLQFSTPSRHNGNDSGISDPIVDRIINRQMGATVTLCSNFTNNSWILSLRRKLGRRELNAPKTSYRGSSSISKWRRASKLKSKNKFPTKMYL